MPKLDHCWLQFKTLRRSATDAEACCGFGGLFAVQMPQISSAMGERKAKAIEASGADLMVTGETGCLLQMAGLLSRRGSVCRSVHLAELLAGIVY